MKMVLNSYSNSPEKKDMSKTKILIVEDELVVSMMIEEFLLDIGYHIVASVTNYEHALKSLESESIDLALLDIELEGSKNGIDLANLINEKYHIPILFLTSQSDFETINKAKVQRPAGYLLKPFTKEDLYSSIEIAIFNHTDTPHSIDETDKPGRIAKDALFVKKNQQIIKVDFSAIHYFKSDHVYMEIVTTDGQTYLIRNTIQELMEKLPSHFFSPHRSYIVNLNYLELIESGSILIGPHSIPLSRNKKNLLLQTIGY